MSQSLELVECLLVLALLHEPSRGLGAEEDQDSKRDGGDECGTELKSPCDSPDILDNCVGTDYKPSMWRVKERHTRNQGKYRKQSIIANP